MNSPETLMATAIAALILRPAWSWAQTATEPNKYDWDHMSPMMWGGSWFGMIFGPLFALGTRRGHRGRRHSRPLARRPVVWRASVAACSNSQERFAGEIDRKSDRRVLDR